MIDLTSEVPKQARLGHQAVRQCGGFPLGECCRTQWEYELGGVPLGGSQDLRLHQEEF